MSLKPLGEIRVRRGFQGAYISLTRSSYTLDYGWGYFFHQQTANAPHTFPATHFVKIIRMRGWCIRGSSRPLVKILSEPGTLIKEDLKSIVMPAFHLRPLVYDSTHAWSGDFILSSQRKCFRRRAIPSMNKSFSREFRRYLVFFASNLI